MSDIPILDAPDGMKMATAAYQKGCEAYHNNVPFHYWLLWVDHNHPEQHMDWRDGWLDAQKMAQEQKQKLEVKSCPS